MPNQVPHGGASSMTADHPPTGDDDPRRHPTDGNVAALAEADPLGRPRTGDWRERLQGPKGAVLAFALSRLIVLAGVLPAVLNSKPGAGPWPDLPMADRLTSALSRWDGAWYLWDAARGYPNHAHLNDHLSDVAFYPSYPALVRAVAEFTRLSLPVSAVLISTVLGAVSAVLVWHLAARFTDGPTADRSVLLYVVFPGTFVLSMAYAEALMLVAVAACLLLLLDRRWLLAGLAAALATATRPNALAVLVACGIVAVVEVTRRRDWRALVAPAVGVFGVTSYHLFLWVHSGDLSAWFRSEHEKWHDRPVLPTRAVWNIVADAFRHSPLSLQSGRLNGLVGIIGLGLVLGGLVMLVRHRQRLPLAVTAYTAAALLVPLTSAVVGPRPRMLLAAFPLAILAGSQLRGKAFHVALGLSIAGLFAITLVTSTTLAATP